MIFVGWTENSAMLMACFRDWRYSRRSMRYILIAYRGNVTRLRHKGGTRSCDDSWDTRKAVQFFVFCIFCSKRVPESHLQKTLTELTTSVRRAEMKPAMFDPLGCSSDGCTPLNLIRPFSRTWSGVRPFQTRLLREHCTTAFHSGPLPSTDTATSQPPA